MLQKTEIQLTATELGRFKPLMVGLRLCLMALMLGAPTLGLMMSEVRLEAAPVTAPVKSPTERTERSAEQQEEQGKRE